MGHDLMYSYAMQPDARLKMDAKSAGSLIKVTRIQPKALLGTQRAVGVRKQLRVHVQQGT